MNKYYSFTVRMVLFLLIGFSGVNSFTNSPIKIGTVVDLLNTKKQTLSFKNVGHHIIAEFTHCINLSNCDSLEGVLRCAAERANATILSVITHQFEPDLFDVAGMTGVAVLLESHISVHTWPEYDYASIDVYTCRNISVEKVLEVLIEFFQPKTVRAITLTRGFEE